MGGDYEKTNAREWDPEYKGHKKPDGPVDEWQIVGAPKKRVDASIFPNGSNQSPQNSQIIAGSKRTDGKKIAKPRRLPPNLILEADNKAQQAWRNHEEPKAHVRIPEDLAVHDRGHEAIAKHNSAFIISEPGKGPASTGSKTFGIWGDDEAVSATVKAINEWIKDWRSSSNPNRTSKFAKIASLTPKLRARAENAWKREVKKQKFRQVPPHDTRFGAAGWFHWPVDQYRPEEILGMSFEALDPIRMDCSCYVIYDKTRAMFQVLGEAEDVQTGILRIRKTCFQIAARQVTPVRLYLLHWPDATCFPSHVFLETYDQPAIMSGNQIDSPKQLSSPRSEGVEGNVAHLVQRTALSEERVRKALLQMLPKLHYYRGHIQMRIRLGTFLATQFKKPKDGLYKLEEYEDMIKESQFIGEITQELGDKDMEQAALAAFLGAADFLLPNDAVTNDLAAVKPIYSAVFTFADGAGDLRLSMSWTEAQDQSSKTTAYENISKKWTRLELDTGGTASILDVSLCDLETGMTWHFDLEATQAVEENRLPTTLVDFAHNVGINANEACKRNLNNLFVTHKPYVGHLKSIQQHVSYRYRPIWSDYTLSLHRFQNRTYPPRRSLVLPGGEPTIYEPRWGLDIHREEWNQDFAKNERLSIGEMADWQDDVEKWFPKDLKPQDDDRTGFEQLMEKLSKVAKLVREMKEVDLMGGMAIE